jgi:hypothetical protein
VEHLQRWSLDALCDAAALCVTELASNAILHSRTPFTVAVRRLADGTRIDVQDDRPDRLPAPVPSAGLGPLDSGTTGRGLRLIAGLASRWGFFNTDLAKTVWAELFPGGPARPADPVVELATRPAPLAGAVNISFLDLPVKVAVASGAQVDDLVRQVQLDPARLDDAARQTFYRLLEASARPRLVGRHQAFRAAGEGSDRFSFEVAISPEEAAATAALSAFLQQMVDRGVVQPSPVGRDVNRLRAWLAEEYTAQSGGGQARPFSG